MKNKKIRISEELITKMNRVFSKNSEIQTNEGLSRAELRKLFNAEIVERRMMRSDSGSMFFTYRLSAKGGLIS